jgi:ComF family protein
LSNPIRSALDSCLDFARQVGSQPCLLCGAATHAGLLCPGCRGDLPLLPERRCPRCAQPTPLGEVCGGCLRHPPAFGRCTAVYRYAHPLDSLIQALKYRGELAVARYLGADLADRLLAAPRPDLIIPMPLHPYRLRERGFNQAAELARHLARRVARPIVLDACLRCRDSAPQAGLSLKARIKNMRGAFNCHADLAGRHVALVDDVMTSGASMQALAQAAIDAGATEVSAWVIARTVRD